MSSEPGVVLKMSRLRRLTCLELMNILSSTGFRPHADVYFLRGKGASGNRRGGACRCACSPVSAHSSDTDAAPPYIPLKAERTWAQPRGY